MSLSDLATGSAQSTFLPNAMNYRGAWSALTTYYKNNVVIGSNNEAYICSVASSLNQDPTATPASWTAMSVPIVPVSPSLTPIPGANYTWTGGNNREFSVGIPGLVQNGIYYVQFVIEWGAVTSSVTVGPPFVYNSCLVAGVDLTQSYILPKAVNAPIVGSMPPQTVTNFFETAGFYFQFNPAGGDQGNLEFTAASCDEFDLVSASVIRVG
jgi:hypothetical protein